MVPAPARPVHLGRPPSRQSAKGRISIFAPLEDVRRNGSAPYVPAAYVNWCGHAQEFVPILPEDGMCQFVPIMEARRSG